MRTLPLLADSRCRVCSQTLTAGARCSNRICGWHVNRRGFTRVDAIAMFSSPLDGAIRAFKYEEGKAAWAVVFGRLVLGWLQTHEDQVADVDLIVGNPTPPDRQPLQHIERILAAAAAEDTREHWPLRPYRVLVKPDPTPRSAGGSWQEKMAAAKEHAAAIRLGESVEGKNVVLFDDIFTTGAQTSQVALMLREAGASSVRGLVLARTPWGS
ncbi:ComF family protein [Actinomadura syzygii]|uniref:ComF family protein n=1 Tax=Actinomadura syzygii TaxID=1427538 RepID=A0A5D0TSA7_9ACTN|nr:ComF family protein [Actinomadura syzygii]TYC08593.1 ComF family protein [Actinomadura syzygii]